MVWESSAAATIVLVWRGTGIASVAPVRCSEVRVNVGPGTLWLMYGGIEGLSSSDLDSQGMKGEILWKLGRYEKVQLSRLAGARLDREGIPGRMSYCRG